MTGHLDAGMPSAWQRFIRTAMSEGVIAEDERFSMRGRKHREITGTEGNHGDKQDAAGHKSPTTTGRYDHDVPVVKPPRERRFFPCSFPCGTKKAPGCSRNHKLTVRIKQLLSAQFAQTRQLSEAARPSLLSIRGLPLNTNARLH